MRSVPVIVTEVLPLVNPVKGEIAVMVGSIIYVKLVVADPAGVVTVTVTVPAEWEGILQIIWVFEKEVIVAAEESNNTIGL